MYEPMLLQLLAQPGWTSLREDLQILAYGSFDYSSVWGDTRRDFEKVNLHPSCCYVPL